MTPHIVEKDALDALARALCKADGKVYWTAHIPVAYRQQAAALIADGWRILPPGVGDA